MSSSSQYYEISQENRFIPHESDEEKLYSVKEIIAEKGRKYQVIWEGDDPATGKPWEPWWVSKKDVTDDLKVTWKAKQAAKKAKPRKQRKTTVAAPKASTSKPVTKKPRISALTRQSSDGRGSSSTARQPSRLNDPESDGQGESDDEDQGSESESKDQERRSRSNSHSHSRGKSLTSTSRRRINELSRLKRKRSDSVERDQSSNRDSTARSRKKRKMSTAESKPVDYDKIPSSPHLPARSKPSGTRKTDSNRAPSIPSIDFDSPPPPPPPKPPRRRTVVGHLRTPSDSEEELPHNVSTITVARKTTKLISPSKPDSKTAKSKRVKTTAEGSSKSNTKSIRTNSGETHNAPVVEKTLTNTGHRTLSNGDEEDLEEPAPRHGSSGRSADPSPRKLKTQSKVRINERSRPNSVDVIIVQRKSPQKSLLTSKNRRIVAVDDHYDSSTPFKYNLIRKSKKKLCFSSAESESEKGDEPPAALHTLETQMTVGRADHGLQDLDVPFPPSFDPDTDIPYHTPLHGRRTCSPTSSHFLSRSRTPHARDVHDHEPQLSHGAKERLARFDAECALDEQESYSPLRAVLEGPDKTANKQKHNGTVSSASIETNQTSKTKQTKNGPTARPKSKQNLAKKLAPSPPLLSRRSHSSSPSQSLSPRGRSRVKTRRNGAPVNGKRTMAEEEDETMIVPETEMEYTQTSNEQSQLQPLPGQPQRSRQTPSTPPSKAKRMRPVPTVSPSVFQPYLDQDRDDDEHAGNNPREIEEEDVPPISSIEQFSSPEKPSTEDIDEQLSPVQPKVIKTALPTEQNDCYEVENPINLDTTITSFTTTQTTDSDKGKIKVKVYLPEEEEENTQDLEEQKRIAVRKELDLTAPTSSQVVEVSNGTQDSQAAAVAASPQRPSRLSIESNISAALPAGDVEGVNSSAYSHELPRGSDPWLTDQLQYPEPLLADPDSHGALFLSQDGTSNQDVDMPSMDMALLQPNPDREEDQPVIPHIKCDEDDAMSTRSSVTSASRNTADNAFDMLDSKMREIMELKRQALEREKKIESLQHQLTDHDTKISHLQAELTVQTELADELGEMNQQYDDENAKLYDSCNSAIERADKLEVEQKELLAKTEHLHLFKQDLQERFELLEKQYRDSSRFVREMQIENQRLEQEAAIARDQAKFGVASIKTMFEAEQTRLKNQIKKLMDEKIFMQEMDRRSDGEVIRRKAAQWDDLDAKNKKLQADLSESAVLRRIAERELEQKVKDERKTFEEKEASIRELTGVTGKMEEMRKEYRELEKSRNDYLPCPWRQHGRRCPKYFVHMEDLVEHTEAHAQEEPPS